MRTRSRLRLRLSAATALVVALAVVLTACGSGGGGRRGHGSSGGTSGGSSVDDDDDYDIDADDLDDLPTDDFGTDGPAPTDPSSVSASAILPDLAALTGTVFSVGGEASADAGVCDDYPEVCANVTDRAQVAFTNPAQDEFASFQVLVYPSAAEAEAALRTGEAALVAEGGYTERERDAFGDASLAYDARPSDGDDAQVTIIQVGPYAGVAARTADDAALLADWDLADALSAMFGERLSQAEAGQQPTARVDV